MPEDFSKRISLVKRFEKLMSLGIWSEKIPQPDPLTLERIQKLNDDIETELYNLYLPNGRDDPKIDQVKREMRQASAKKKHEIVQDKAQSQKATGGLNFLGKGVSDWLNFTDEDTDLLKGRKLLPIPNIEELASFLDTNAKRIIWLSYHKEITTNPLYKEFQISKGKGYRTISVPSPPLKVIHEIIKENILDNIILETYVHGFRRNHNILDNAKEHTNAKSLVTIDINDFFGTINFKMVRKAFNSLGYSKQISSLLALLTTKPVYAEVTVGSKKFWNCSADRFLPQGASTSPGISNLVASRFDYQLYERSKKLGFIYTRYADDLTFSTRREKANHKAILYLAKETLKLHGFTVNPSKVRLLFPHHRQEVTGLILNSGKPTIPRQWRKNLRAAVHQFRFIENGEDQLQEYYRIMGSIQHLKLAHPRLAQRYQIEIDRYLRTKE